jgi:hypothetical protein
MKGSRRFTEQVADEVSSFGTTINILEGLLEHERGTGGSARVGEG